MARGDVRVRPGDRGLLAGPSASAQFDLFDHFEREVPAVDYRTGDVMMAPPVPYGEYAKDYAGSVHEAVGLAAGSVHGLLGKVCGLCGGPACGLCGGLGHHTEWRELR